MRNGTMHFATSPRAVARLAGIAGAAALAVAAPLALASDPPHNATKLPNTCRDCHTAHNSGLPGLIQQGTDCLSCHNTRGLTSPNWTLGDQAVPGTSGSSHSWTGNPVNPTYGASLPTDASMQSRISGNALSCIVCHDPHTQANAPADPTAPAYTAGQGAGRHFLRLANVSNQMCVNCHSAWNMTAATPTFYTGTTSNFSSTSTAVTGTGFSQLQPGQQIKRTADTAPTAFTVIQSIQSDTALTLAVNYKGTTGTGAWEAGKTMSHPVSVALGTGLSFAPPKETSGTAQVAGWAGTATGGTTTTLTDTNKNFTGAATLIVRFTKCANTANNNVTRTISSITGTTTINFTALAAAIAAGDRYEIDVDGNTSNNVVLDSAGTASWTAGNVGCMSCHGVHYADSNAATYDGNPQTGNGLLLRRANTGESCTGCHPTTIMHNSTTVGTKHGTWGTTFTCRTCHEPHQGTNLGLVERQIATPSTGTVTIDYRSAVTGQEPNGQINAASAAIRTVGNGPCEACHTDTRNGALYTTGTVNTNGTTTVNCNTGCNWVVANAYAGWEFRLPTGGATAWTRVASNTTTALTLDVAYAGTATNVAYELANPRFRTAYAGRGNQGSGRGAVGNEHPTAKCTGCHQHSGGFGAAESRGNQVCGMCHSYGMIAGGSNPESNRTSTYHHVMETDVVLSGTPTALTEYPNTAQPTLADGIQNKTCTQCHADHNLFRPDVNTSGNRASNQRVAIGTNNLPRQDTSTSPLTPAVAPGSTFTNTDWASATPYGICMSCHASTQTKDQTNQLSDGTTGTYAINATAFTSSKHNYSVGDATKAHFSNDTATPYFLNNCVKCHNSETASYQNGTYKFSLHASPDRRLRAPMGMTAPADNMEEKFCYRCHSESTDTNPGGGPPKSTTSQDYYQTAAMSAGSTGIFKAISNAGVSSAPTQNATVLYLRNNATANAVDGPAPTTWILSSGTYQGTTTYTAYDMGLTTGTTTVTKSNTSGATASRYLRFGQFISPPVGATVQIPSGSVFTINTRSLDSTDVCYERFQIWACRSGVACTTTSAVPFASAAVQSPTAMPDAATNHSNPFTTTSTVTLYPGDGIIMEIEAYKTTTTSTTVSEIYGGAPATYVENLTFPNGITIPFQTAAATTGRGHGVGSYSGIHKPIASEDNAALATAAGKHVECEDCHDPHKAQAGLHATPGNAGGLVLTGAPSVTPTTTAAGNWETAIATTYTAGTWASGNPEYYVCYRCHSTNNPFIPNDPATAATTPWNSTTYGFTNQALEFRTTNNAGHPVAGARPTANRLVAAQLVGADHTWAVGSVMTCTDCHADDVGTGAGQTAAMGPHGSAVKFMLTGTNKNWPYTNTTGTTLATITSTAGSGVTFCRNCHPDVKSADSNAFHRLSGAGSSTHTATSTPYQTCLGCHIRVPHGGKVSRLIVTPNAPARYRQGVTGWTFAKFVKNTNKDAYAWNQQLTCGSHGNVATTGEAW